MTGIGRAAQGDLGLRPLGLTSYPRFQDKARLQEDVQARSGVAAVTATVTVTAGTGFIRLYGLRAMLRFGSTGLLQITWLPILPSAVY